MTREMVTWDGEAIAILREVYPDGGWRGVQERLPGFTRQAIQKRANKLGIKSNNRFGVSQNRRKDRPLHFDIDPHWPVPSMGLQESLDCIRMRKWRGPVSSGFGLGRVA